MSKSIALFSVKSDITVAPTDDFIKFIHEVHKDSNIQLSKSPSTFQLHIDSAGDKDGITFFFKDGPKRGNKRYLFQLPQSVLHSLQLQHQRTFSGDNESSILLRGTFALADIIGMFWAITSPFLLCIRDVGMSPQTPAICTHPHIPSLPPFQHLPQPFNIEEASQSTTSNKRKTRGASDGTKISYYQIDDEDDDFKDPSASDFDESETPPQPKTPIKRAKKNAVPSNNHQDLAQLGKDAKVGGEKPKVRVISKSEHEEYRLTKDAGSDHYARYFEIDDENKQIHILVEKGAVKWTITSFPIKSGFIERLYELGPELRRAVEDGYVTSFFEGKTVVASPQPKRRGQK